MPSIRTQRSVDTLVEELAAHPVNRHPFFIRFRDRPLSRPQLQHFTRQYHYFCFRFVKVLEGLLYHTPLEAIDMRVELTKTLYSELGNGVSEHAHVRYLENFAIAIGLDKETLAHTEPIDEVRAYLATLESLWLQDKHLVALGAALAVEITALSEFQYFVPGLQHYPELSDHDRFFFSMHLDEEAAHGSWLTDAVRKTAMTQDELSAAATGAHTVADAWYRFWTGIEHSTCYSSEPLRP